MGKQKNISIPDKFFEKLSELKGTSVKLYMALLNSDEQSSYSELMIASGISKPSLSEAIKELVSEELIEVASGIPKKNQYLIL